MSSIKSLFYEEQACTSNPQICVSIEIKDIFLIPWFLSCQGENVKATLSLHWASIREVPLEEKSVLEFFQLTPNLPLLEFPIGDFWVI